MDRESWIYLKKYLRDMKSNYTKELLIDGDKNPFKKGCEQTYEDVLRFIRILEDRPKKSNNMPS